MGAPSEISRVAEVMEDFAPPWALCGGWAVDAWLGKTTRSHEDVDVSIWDEHQQDVFSHLGGWRLVGHVTDEDHDEEWDGRPLAGPGHIHATSQDDFRLEVLLADHARHDWILRKDPFVAYPLLESVRVSDWGVPTVVPEILLFYKATAYFADEPMAERTGRDERDFRALVPTLSNDGLSWLEQAVAEVMPGHPWLPGWKDES
jgi:hypothetical protein